MSGLVPFSYLPITHQRRHSPIGYVDYPSFKPWLRDEFRFRCVYCLMREVWYPSGHAAFSADHIVPRSHDPALAFQYDNLLYACVRCNSFRRDIPMLDPTAEAIGDHLSVDGEGTVHALTPHGQFIIDVLQLNSDDLIKRRRYCRRILILKEKLPYDSDVEELFVETFGYPADLPDLAALRPPKGNLLAGNVGTSCYALREAGILGSVY